MIGQGGRALVGSQVGVPPQFQPRYTITDASQVATGGWEYEITPIRLGQTKWVAGDDDAFGPAAQAAVNPAVAQLQAQINGLLVAAPDINLAPWVPHGVTTNTMSRQLAFQGQKVTAGNADGDIVWSGGAGDCIIVAAHGAQESYIVHQDRSQPASAAIAAEIHQMAGAQKSVYLASQMFSVADPTDSGLVRSIMQALAAYADINIVAIYPFTALALNPANGQVRYGGKPLADQLS